jgi:ubiquinone/menaquinone biosynthesis C-methylase UbiE
MVFWPRTHDRENRQRHAVECPPLRARRSQPRRAHVAGWAARVLADRALHVEPAARRALNVLPRRERREPRTVAPLARCPDPREALYEHRARHLPPAVHAELIAYLPRHAARVLDLGCGSGVLALQLARCAPFVIGLDPSRTMVALARERQGALGRQNVAWVVARAEEPPFRPHSMDYIVSVNALRLTDTAATLAAVKHVIRPGGRVAIRDHLTPSSWLGFWITYLAHTVRLALEWVRDYGGKGLGRILAYRVSPAGLDHARRNAALTRATFERIYSQALPGCRVEATRGSGLAVWEATEPSCVDGSCGTRLRMAIRYSTDSIGGGS